MATTATDTGNQFADAWTNNQWTGAKKATDIKPVAADGKNAEVDAYRAAWAKENGGQYGNINIAPTSALTPVMAAPTAPEASKFVQQGEIVNGMNMAMPYGGVGNLIGVGGYGSWRYGMPTPQAGTPEFADFQAYWNNGGMDPNNHYGRAAETARYAQAWKNPNDMSHLWTSGDGQSGNGGVGIGDTGAGAAAAASGNTAW